METKIFEIGDTLSFWEEDRDPKRERVTIFVKFIGDMRVFGVADNINSSFFHLIETGDFTVWGESYNARYSERNSWRYLNVPTGWIGGH